MVTAVTVIPRIRISTTKKGIKCWCQSVCGIYCWLRCKCWCGVIIISSKEKKSTSFVGVAVTFVHDTDVVVVVGGGKGGNSVGGK